MITNVELDHHSRWGSRAELLEAFGRFAEPASALALHLRPAAATRSPVAPRERSRRGRFDTRAAGPAAARAPGPGPHNLANARAALAALELAGFDSQGRGEALESFPGMCRRLERKGTSGGAEVYDDYAHHPTEVAAALAGAARARRRAA